MQQVGSGSNDFLKKKNTNVLNKRRLYYKNTRITVKSKSYLQSGIPQGTVADEAGYT
jgi:hypothetical protein